MVFGSGNKFRIRRSQSKASYMASRRERDKFIPDPDSGSYKRTLSPNRHIITANDTTTQETSKLSREHWSTLKNKEQYTNNNNGNITRRPSMCEPATKNGGDIKEDLKKTQQQPLVLPDVLPINAKILSPRSQHHHHTTREFRPSNLNLSPLDNNYQPTKSPPKSPPPPTNSPPKSPSRNSPYAPLRSTNLSNSPLRTPSLRLSSPQGSSSPVSSTPQYSTPLRVYPSKESTAEIRSNSLCVQRNETKTMQRASFHQEIRTSNAQRISPSTSPNSSSSFSSVSSQSMPLPGRFSPTPKVVPEIKPTLSPNLSNKMVPIKSFSPSMVFSASTPLKTSPESSPPSSPKVLSSSPPPSPKNLSIAPSSPENPKEIITSKVVEGLQMIQRTEVVLRVNTTTIDASSQTEKEELTPTPLPTRRKLQEEIECEKLSQDFVNQLPVTDKLKHLLVPAPEHKKITDYVTGLFRVDVTLKPRAINAPFRSRNHSPSSTPPPPCNSGPSSTTSMTTNFSDTISIISSLEPTSPLPATSPYFTTSEPKAKFLTRYSQDMNHYMIKNTKDLNRKKDELVHRLDRKLEVLRGEQLVISEECRINDELGQNVEDHIAKVARSTETAKFRLHIEEVGKITSLLLGLSGRLARVENALIGMCEDNPEKRILETKRDKLLEQLEEAKKLKESIDKRSVSVSNILYKYLNSEEYADYDHFINMKAKLIMDSKDIGDKIKLGEEQLTALKETLIVSD